MAFQSILFKTGESITHKDAPVFFSDLNLDQVVNAVTSGKEEYNLKPFYYTSLDDPDTIRYRHEVMQDIENPGVFEVLKLFGRNMFSMRQYLAEVENLSHNYQQESWFLDAADAYCNAVGQISHDISNIELKSRGLLAFREFLNGYVQSGQFTSLLNEIKRIKASLSSVKYSVYIKNLRVQVRNCGPETDYSAEIEETFAKFRHGTVKNYKVAYSEALKMNYVEERILEGVARLNPEVFSQLDTFYSEHLNFQDKRIITFDREIQFYIVYIDYMAIFRQAGLKFCYPQVFNNDKEIFNIEGFDLALAHKLVKANSTVVVNDFFLREKERIIVVSGPNQGGKTTFARTFGQLHYLANLGLPVPGKEAWLFLYDRIFTHFEKEEDIKNLRSKLEDDLVRIQTILTQATTNSILIMNEILTSTTLQDAVFLSRKIMDKIIGLDMLCVWVSFIDELSTVSEKTISMVSTVVPDEPALRTFQIVRKPADGLAYALSIAEKYHLTFDSLIKRILP